MHEFQHVIPGHSAVGSIKQALGIGAEDIVNQADDLSIGPLGDVDTPGSPLRLAFLQEIWGFEPDIPESDFQLISDLVTMTGKSFRDLPRDPRPCLVWHGNNANEELTLRRTAYFLADSPRPLWTIEILPEDQRPLPLQWCTGVGVLNPKELTRVYARRRLIAHGDRTRLAADWRRLSAESSRDTMRHAAGGQVKTCPIDSRDSFIAGYAEREWGNAARLVGNAMGHAEDAYLNDTFIFWRVRQLAQRGLLELEPLNAPMRESLVRRAG